MLFVQFYYFNMYLCVLRFTLIFISLLLVSDEYDFCKISIILIISTMFLKDFTNYSINIFLTFTGQLSQQMTVPHINRETIISVA